MLQIARQAAQVSADLSPLAAYFAEGVLRRTGEAHRRLAELRVADREHAINEVNVARIEAQRLVTAHAGRGVQAEQRGICAGGEGRPSKAMPSLRRSVE
ncbi:hypothetical protein [Mesorhizobium sp. M1273]|uniref:hypothetical protein n=1 Tax=Mesorhizobium sp. M1273 TaxID=2957075 RepID=UPI003335AE0F